MNGEQIVSIIDALENDRTGHPQVNVPYRGAPAGIPDDMVVEVPAIVSGRGIQPLHVGALPFWFGRSTAESRCNRFGATGRLPLRLVVLWNRWVCLARRYSACINRATRFMLYSSFIFFIA